MAGDERRIAAAQGQRLGHAAVQQPPPGEARRARRRRPAPARGRSRRRRRARRSARGSPARRARPPPRRRSGRWRRARCRRRTCARSRPRPRAPVTAVSETASSRASTASPHPGGRRVGRPAGGQQLRQEQRQALALGVQAPRRRPSRPAVGAGKLGDVGRGSAAASVTRSPSLRRSRAQACSGSGSSVRRVASSSRRPAVQPPADVAERVERCRVARSAGRRRTRRPPRGPSPARAISWLDGLEKPQPGARIVEARRAAAGRARAGAGPPRRRQWLGDARRRPARRPRRSSWATHAVGEAALARRRAAPRSPAPPACARGEELLGEARLAHSRLALDHGHAAVGGDPGVDRRSGAATGRSRPTSGWAVAARRRRPLGDAAGRRPSLTAL